MIQVRGVPFASLSTTMGAWCQSPWTHLIVSFVPQAMWRTWSQTTSTPATTLLEHACVTVYAMPHYNTWMMIPASTEYMAGATWFFPVGPSTRSDCSPRSSSCRTTGCCWLIPSPKSHSHWNSWETLGQWTQSSKGVMETCSCILTWN